VGRKERKKRKKGWLRKFMGIRGELQHLRERSVGARARLKIKDNGWFQKRGKGGSIKRGIEKSGDTRNSKGAVTGKRQWQREKKHSEHRRGGGKGEFRGRDARLLSFVVGKTDSGGESPQEKR